MRGLPKDLPDSIRQYVEPCRALPRGPTRTWERPDHTPAAAWSLLRQKRAMAAVKWPKLVAGTPRSAHVDALVARLDSPDAPAALLAPEVEATWLWLESVKSAKPGDAESLVVDVWATVDPVTAVRSLIAFAEVPDREGASMEAPRRLRAHLSIADEGVWRAARDAAHAPASTASRDGAALASYLFPEDEARANALAKKVKSPFGYEHLLSLASTDATAVARIVKKAGNAWGLIGLLDAIPAWAVVALGEEAVAVLEIFGKRWPDHVAAARAYLTQRGQ